MTTKQLQQVHDTVHEADKDSTWCSSAAHELRDLLDQILSEILVYGESHGGTASNYSSLVRR
jgi:hypothetical protein